MEVKVLVKSIRAAGNKVQMWIPYLSGQRLAPASWTRITPN